LGQRQRRLLLLGEDANGLFPRRQQGQLLFADAALACVGTVHVEAERAVVHLRRANLDQLRQIRVDVLCGRVVQYDDRFVDLGRDAVEVDTAGGVSGGCYFGALGVGQGGGGGGGAGHLVG